MYNFLLAGQLNTFSKNYSEYSQIIDTQIEKSFKAKLEPAVVLSGMDADEILRKSRFLKYSELVFDTNKDAITYITNLRSGLYLTAGPCLATPILYTQWSAEEARQLVNKYYQLERSENVDVITIDSELLSQVNFPCLITPVGAQKIRETCDRKATRQENSAVSQKRRRTSLFQL